MMALVSPTLASFAITGSPRTKKTSQRIVQIKAKGDGRGFTKILPSEAHEQWFKAAMLQAPFIRMALKSAGFELPIAAPVNVCAIFYLERNSGDLTGFMQALADYLQEPRWATPKPGKPQRLSRNGAGVIKDDSQIAGWDGSRLRKDASCPRIEIAIRIVGPSNGELFAEEEF